MTERNDDPPPAVRTRALIESQMPQRSLSQLGRDIGFDNLSRRLNQAAHGHNIPLDLLVAVHKATDITFPELLVAMVDDAGYGEYWYFPVLDAEMVQLATDVLGAEPEQRALLAATLRWMKTLKSD